MEPGGAFVLLVAVQLSVLGSYLPPLFARNSPPQTIILLPVQTVVCNQRGEGALVKLVAVQLSVLGLYLPPLLTAPESPMPPQTIISLAVQNAVRVARSEEDTSRLQ